MRLQPGINDTTGPGGPIGESSHFASPRLVSTRLVSFRAASSAIRSTNFVVRQIRIRPVIGPRNRAGRWYRQCNVRWISNKPGPGTPLRARCCVCVCVCEEETIEGGARRCVAMPRTRFDVTAMLEGRSSCCVLFSSCSIAARDTARSRAALLWLARFGNARRYNGRCTYVMRRCGNT